MVYGEHSCNVLVSPPGLSICVPVSKKPQTTWCKLLLMCSYTLCSGEVANSKKSNTHWSDELLDSPNVSITREAIPVTMVMGTKCLCNFTRYGC